MLISMETLSQMIPRTDSGTGGKGKTPAFAKTDSVFEKIFDQSRAAMDNLRTNGTGKTDEIPDEKDAGIVVPKKPDDSAEDGETLAAGVMGYQNAIVFILEGDKESATTSETCVEDVEAIGDIAPETTVSPVGTGTEAVDTGNKQQKSDGIDDREAKAVGSAETEPDEKTGQARQTAPQQAGAKPDTAAEGAKTETNTLTGADVKAAVAVDAAANADAVEAPDIVDTENTAGITAGEVTARRPEIGTSEQRNDEGKNSEISENGDLSPLENENDTIPVSGTKEKQNSEMGNNAAKNNDGKTQEAAVGDITPFTADIKPERFQADQQMKRAVDIPVRAENLFDEMVSRIETMQTESRQTMTIQLKPEFLGKVALEIAMDAAGLHVRINAANNDVRSAINGQIDALVESLELKGIEVAEVEVAYTGVDSGAFADSNKNQAQPDNHRRSYRTTAIEDSAAFYAVLPAETLEYYLDAGVSSVEFRA